MLPPAVVFVDPGGMNGFAMLFTPPGTYGRVWCGEWEFYEAAAMLETVLISYQGNVAVGWERFTINSTTHRKTPQPEALHFIGVLRLLTRKYRCRVLPEAQQQSPSKGEQAKLKAIGWWVPGKDDAQSAAAHLLRWLLQTGEIPPQEAEILNALQGE